MRDTIEVFRRHFSKWVKAFNESNGYAHDVDTDELFQMLRDRIRPECLMTLGGGLLDGWIKAESGEGRGYFITSNDRERSDGLVSVYNAGKGQITPWWELYVQLSDYVQLRFVAELLGLKVHLEDGRMDIAVWDDDILVLYCENKVKSVEAKALVRGMSTHGEEGFDLLTQVKAKDPLKKARYLFDKDRRPGYFVVSTLDYQAVYRVEYLEGNHRFRLHEVPAGIYGPLLDESFLSSRSLNSVQRLAIAIMRKLDFLNLADRRRTWFSPGTGQTVFNFYVYSQAVDRQALALGAYENGQVWSELRSLGTYNHSRLVSNLAAIGIQLEENGGKSDAFWRQRGNPFDLAGHDVDAISHAVVDALFPGCLA